MKMHGGSRLALAVLIGMAMISFTQTAAVAQFRSYGGHRCPCPPRTQPIPHTDSEDGSVDPNAEDTPDVDFDAATAPVASATGGATGAMGYTPGTFGDLGGGTLSVGPAFNIVATGSQGASIAIGGGDRFQKFVDNTSPLPRDRVFFNYHYFASAVSGANQAALGTETSLNRYTVGIERTLYDGLASVEIKVPFTVGLDADQVFGGPGGNSGSEFGNLGLTFKGILWTDGCSRTLSAGLGITLPTADDASIVTLADSLRVQNQAVHLQPFVGYVVAPNQNLFYQFLFQLDVDVSGYNISSTVAGPSTINDPTLFFASASTGYWIYRNNSCRALIAGIAPMVELHYTTALDVDVDPNGVVAYREGSFDLLNLSAGIHTDLGRGSSLRVFAGLPLRGSTFADSAGNSFDNDRFFDTEVAVQFNYGY